MSNPATFCGEGTIYDSDQQKCIYFAKEGSEDLKVIFDDAAHNSELLNTSSGVVFRDKPLTNISNQVNNEPYWYSHWVKNGRYDANKEISGENFFGDGVNCSCGDCAGWRGGNAGTCAGYNVTGRGSNNLRRVGCDNTFTPDKCVCVYPYVPINGLCVTPFDTNNGKPCCSSCIYDASCVGEETCEGECQEKKVQYPGVRYVCNGSFTPSQDLENSVRASTQEISANCNVSEGASEMNEYECALKCGNSGPDCSKLCLPHLWKWKELWDESSNQLMGYVQTNDLIQFQPGSSEISWCPESNAGCRVSVSAPMSIPLQCSNCENCVWAVNPVTDKYEYTCANCNTCMYHDSTLCKSNGQCRGCFEVTDPSNTVRKSIECASCESTTQCSQPQGSQAQPNPNFESYNQGQSYAPEDVSIWENWYEVGDLGAAVACEAYGGTSSCDASYTNLSADKGMLEGGALGFVSIANRDCRQRGSCAVKRHHYVNEEKCYGGLTYQQMNTSSDCQDLPLPPTSSTNDVPLSDIVSMGVAKGVSRNLCKEAFCKVWNNQWKDIPQNECDWICNPENTGIQVPELMTTKEQLTFMRQQT